MKIVGIDPGLRATGYGVIDHEEKIVLIEAGVIKTRAQSAIAERLKSIYDGIHDLLVELKPDVLVIEKIYAHYKHPATAILMGHARGVICLAASMADTPLESLSSTRVKKAVISHGHATKEQIQRAVQRHLSLSKPPHPADVADALAIAIAYALTRHAKARGFNQSPNKMPRFANRVKGFA